VFDRVSTASGRRGRRVGRLIALVVAVAVGAAYAVVWLGSALRERSALRGAFPQVTGSIRLVGPAAPVLVDRDARGVPHVRAESERDAFFALGFVHAQDRLGQMLWLERLARGRSAEVIGPEALEWDRRARVIGFGRLADAQIERLADDTRRVLEAYAAGVNARIDQIVAGKVGAPLAVRILELPLETWEPADSLAVFKAFAWGLGASVDESLVLQELIQNLGAAGSRPFFPRRGRGLVPAARTTAGTDPPEPRAGAMSPDPLRRALGLYGPSVGSSAWVIGGAHTVSGRPILVADSHLAPTVPPHFHLDHLRAGDLDVAGTTLPGVPVFWTGRNARVAWASVHAGAVVTDLFVEAVDPNDPSRHHDGRKWRSLSERIEVLRVRGAPDEELRVASTRHGPLLPVREGRDPISVAWTGAQIDGPSGIGSLLGVARAANAGAIVEALRLHHEPVLAVAFADSEGASGMQVAGWIPRRALSPGLLPLPGRARWYDWADPVPFDSLPRKELSDGKGWIVVADGPFPVRQGREPVEWLWRSGERAERIEQLLASAIAAGPVDLRGMAALQSDVGGIRANALIERVLTLVELEGGEALSPEAAEIAAILRDWDGHSRADSLGAAVYHKFVSTLTETLLGQRLGDALLQHYLVLTRTVPEQVLLEIVREATGEAGPNAWDERASVARSVRESLQQTWLRLSFSLGANRRHWTWGRLHALRFEPFGGLAERLGKRAQLGPYPYPGSRETISAAGYDLSESFRVRIASTARFAVDSGELDQSLAALAPGQSEHPGHPNFADGIPGWLDGRTTLLMTGSLLVEEASLARLVLEPVR